MPLTEKSRSALYLGLQSIVDEHAIEEMLSYFPARDVEEPVTKEFLRAELADVRTDLADLRTELRAEIADVRTDLANLRTELRAEIADVRTDLGVELRDALRAQTQWLVGLMVTLAAVVVGVVTLAG